MWYYVIKIIIVVVFFSLGTLLILKPQIIAGKDKKCDYVQLQKVKRCGVCVTICGVINLLLLFVDFTL